MSPTMLSVFDPDAHRTISSVRTQDLAKARRILNTAPISEDVLDAAAQQAARTSAVTIPEADRAAYRRAHTLMDVYRDLIEPARRLRVRAGSLARGTLEKELQTIRWLARYTRPQSIDAADWPGQPLAYLTPGVIQTAFDRAGHELAVGTLNSFRSNLRTVLNAAVEIGALESVPKIRLPKAVSTTVIYTDAEITSAYGALRQQPALQVAFVVGLNTGLRSCDLFLLRWADLVADESGSALQLKARKTAKLQRIPLAPVTERHIRRLPQVSPWLFPGLSAPESTDPEKSGQARSRTSMVKYLFEPAGLPCRKPADKFYLPFQVCRPTCNERLERVAPGAGCFVLGHSLGLNSQSYREPSAYVRQAILDVPQPECFLAEVGL